MEVKSKFDAEFRRFSLDRAKYKTFEAFHALLEGLHALKGRKERGRADEQVQEAFDGLQECPRLQRRKFWF